MSWLEDAVALLNDDSKVGCDAGHAAHNIQKIAIDNGTGCTEIVGFIASDYADTAGYCPGDDDVSRTLVATGRWEPVESDIFRQAIARSPGIVIDFGTQIGWYTLIALAMGREVLAVEAVAEHEAITALNAANYGWSPRLFQAHRWVDIKIPRLPHVGAPEVAIAKIDLEGNDEFAVDCLLDLIDDGLVDNLLVEISPVFNDSYPDLVMDLMHLDYHAAVVNPWREFGMIEIDEVIEEHPQVDMIFSREAWWAR